jgi:hypothetical protein
MKILVTCSLYDIEELHPAKCKTLEPIHEIKCMRNESSIKKLSCHLNLNFD